MGDIDLGTRCAACGLSAPVALANQWCHRPECVHRPPIDLPPDTLALCSLDLPCERYNKLEAEVKRLREAWARMANTINIVGSDYMQSIQAMDRLVASVKTQARAALKGANDRG